MNSVHSDRKRAGVHNRTLLKPRMGIIFSYIIISLTISTSGDKISPCITPHLSPHTSPQTTHTHSVYLRLSDNDTQTKHQTQCNLHHPTKTQGLTQDSNCTQRARARTPNNARARTPGACHTPGNIVHEATFREIQQIESHY